MPEFIKYGLNEADLIFIQELVLGGVEEAPEEWEWQGRPGLQSPTPPHCIAIRTPF